MFPFALASACNVMTLTCIFPARSAMSADPTTLPSVRSSFPHPESRIHSYHQLVGSEPLDALAGHIWLSVGPSGKNKVHPLPFIFLLTPNHDTQDYLYQLAESVRALAPASYDTHLFALEVGFALIVWSRISAAHGLWLTMPLFSPLHHRLESDGSTGREGKMRRYTDEHKQADGKLGVHVECR